MTSNCEESQKKCQKMWVLANGRKSNLLRPRLHTKLLNEVPVAKKYKPPMRNENH